MAVVISSCIQSQIHACLKASDVFFERRNPHVAHVGEVPSFIAQKNRMLARSHTVSSISPYLAPLQLFHLRQKCPSAPFGQASSGNISSMRTSWNLVVFRASFWGFLFWGYCFTNTMDFAGKHAGLTNMGLQHEEFGFTGISSDILAWRISSVKPTVVTRNGIRQKKMRSVFVKPDMCMIESMCHQNLGYVTPAKTMALIILIGLIYKKIQKVSKSKKNSRNSTSNIRSSSARIGIWSRLDPKLRPWCPNIA